MATPTHDAAMLVSKAGRLSIQKLPTQSPGPNEILIDVKSIALNPVDYYMRDSGFLLQDYPAIPGSDIAGTIAAVGADVPQSSRGTLLRSGTRVAAYAVSIYTQGKPSYGAFQTKVLVPADNVTPLPDTISFNQGASLPMAVVTAWSGITTLDLSYDTKINTTTTTTKKGLLVWGAASSIGLATVQIASKTLGLTVYAVASPRHAEYLQSLGAAAVFDYHGAPASVVTQIITAARAANVSLDLAFHATGDLQSAQEVIAAFTSDGADKGIVATAVPMDASSPMTEGVDTRFILPPPVEQGLRDRHFAFVFARWLCPALDSGAFIPAPETHSVPAGLRGLDVALDRLREGVSALKLVVEL
ncbi:hypothetical protein LTR84_005165 [Exophiala bonariae]|uniref:Enoyl reductase (ER) domain-containing protein n=1 Tax=Exophiala bonariae TaxID=1690606 RepID=A0AAV9NRN7_9EURO|nr:hypothetical protein LTR84_005165 [Exophiala bonariae]